MAAQATCEVCGTAAAERIYEVVGRDEILVVCPAGHGVVTRV